MLMISNVVVNNEGCLYHHYWSGTEPVYCALGQCGLIMFEAVLSFQLHCFNDGPHMQAVHTPNSFLSLNCNKSQTGFFYTVNDSLKMSFLKKKKSNPSWTSASSNILLYAIICVYRLTVCVSKGAWFSRTASVLVQEWESRDRWWPILHGTECAWKL